MAVKPLKVECRPLGQILGQQKTGRVIPPGWKKIDGYRLLFDFGLLFGKSFFFALGDNLRIDIRLNFLVS